MAARTAVRLRILSPPGRLHPPVSPRSHSLATFASNRFRSAGHLGVSFGVTRRSG
jgi:hypothetical protein